MTTVCVYDLKEVTEEDCQEFYDITQTNLGKLNKNNYAIVAGVLNARVGNTRVKNEVGTEKGHSVNTVGQRLRESTVEIDFRITNIF
jgi:hypothetical protein